MSALNCKKTSAGESGSLFALVDERIPKECERALSGYGFNVIKLPAEKKLPAAVASHTDMLIFRHNDTIIISQGYAEKNRELIESVKDAVKGLKIIFSQDVHGDVYPRDAIFNCLSIGNKLFGRPDALSDTVKEYTDKAGLELIAVKQGYPACTTLAIPEKFAVTSDRGMARALQSNGIDVLIISESERICLPPYKCGFIGGASGIFGKTVYFLGNLKSHPDGEMIENALKERGYTSVSLDPEADSLFDLGGIFFFGSAENSTAASGRSTSPAIPKTE